MKKPLLRLQAGSESAFDVKVTDAMGREYQGIHALVYSVAWNREAKIEVELDSAELDVFAKAEFFTNDPVTGERRQIRKIEWADGDESIFAPDPTYLDDLERRWKAWKGLPDLDLEIVEVGGLDRLQFTRRGKREQGPLDEATFDALRAFAIIRDIEKMLQLGGTKRG